MTDSVQILHKVVFWLKTIMIIFYRTFHAAESSMRANNDFSVMGILLLFNNNIIAIRNASINH